MAAVIPNLRLLVGTCGISAVMTVDAELMGRFKNIALSGWHAKVVATHEVRILLANLEPNHLQAALTLLIAELLRGRHGE